MITQHNKCSIVNIFGKPLTFKHSKKNKTNKNRLSVLDVCKLQPSWAENLKKLQNTRKPAYNMTKVVRR